jgi:hypothetical protein
MDLPFTREEFLEVFARLNQELWPLQIVAIALAGLIVGLALAVARRSPLDRVIAAVLASFWLVSGVGFHLRHFTAVNPAAHLFGWAFVAGAASLLWAGCVRNALAFRPPCGWRGILGAVLVAYAIVGYPVVGAAVGHVYPTVPVLGLAPCPTTLLTGGILLWAAAPVPRLVALAPLAWSLVGLSAAVRLGMVEDLGLALSAVACASALADRRRAVGVEPTRQLSS